MSSPNKTVYPPYDNDDLDGRFWPYTTEEQIPEKYVMENAKGPMQHFGYSMVHIGRWAGVGAIFSGGLAGLVEALVGIPKEDSRAGIYLVCGASVLGGIKAAHMIYYCTTKALKKTSETPPDKKPSDTQSVS